MRISTPRRMLPMLLAATAGAGALAASSAADAIVLKSSTPKNGAKVAKLPATIRLTFNIKPKRAQARVTSSDGDNHATSTRVSGRNVIVRTHENEKGRFRVSYKVYDVDGDSKGGSISFTVR